MKDKIEKLEKEHLDIYLGEVRFSEGYQGYDAFKVELIKLFQKEIRKAYKEGEEKGYGDALDIEWGEK